MESSTKFYEDDYHQDSQGVADDEDDTQKCDEEIRTTIKIKAMMTIRIEVIGFTLWSLGYTLLENASGNFHLFFSFMICN